MYSFDEAVLEKVRTEKKPEHGKTRIRESLNMEPENV
jgi:hypothetical protein